MVNAARAGDFILLQPGTAGLALLPLVLQARQWCNPSRPSQSPLIVPLGLWQTRLRWRRYQLRGTACWMP
ncbi:hypothetical protein OEZ86_009912 [Tetradesmus obliquus]|uniref:Uncharacterized protein n=1 Tax=Tetradesmus obliquus TaxID=3088 RepID=A0ABY8UNL4_TETOB|nr:hypothetical protein OEZ85_001349 [Tetradesmus obliquus]WIA43444.1 hypothetical protein OEZ86_009912 [Tetradesmus obliquus]